MNALTPQSKLEVKSKPNPALLRLKKRILTGITKEQVITSYDRMHHRHNRS